VEGDGTSDPERVPLDADFYILSVSDEAIEEVAGIFAGASGIWMHTAGAVSIKLLEKNFSNSGVLYPLQTLSMDRPVSLKETPILVEGSSTWVSEQIMKLASSISNHVTGMDSNHRLAIHLAAVFANNFSNHMVSIAEQILEEHGAELSLLRPILMETFSKLETMGAEAAQTGPALRNDLQTMQKHLELLKDHPEWEKLYTFISRNIKDG
jgi:predicted short-subunit dehydrogenase-like oxidoreductase (DUF2520 family)